MLATFRSSALTALQALVLVACAPPLASAQGPLARSPNGQPLTLAFADEFNTFRPYRNGAGTWRTTFRDGRDDHGDDYNLRTLRWNKELQLYVDPDMRSHDGSHRDGEAPGNRNSERDRPLNLNPFALAKGLLTISADRAPEKLSRDLGGFKYTSGLISTQPSFSQTYGYFEMRAKLPAGKGVWPAFWLLPMDLSWPPEIDVMESVGDPSKVYVTYHSSAAKLDGVELRVAPGAFHVYAVSWTRTDVIWFIDGKEVRRAPTPPDMHKPMYMLANVALGGDWAGQPDASTPFPARLQIDYIRAYRFAS